jgi:DNA-binding XRE family transcriptional regulator
MEWFKKYVGGKIKELRKRQGYSQSQFGQMLDLSRVSVLNIEQGRHSPPLFTIYTICSILNCQPADIMPMVKQVNIKAKEVTVIKRIIKKEMKPIVIKRKP